MDELRALRYRHKIRYIHEGLSLFTKPPKNELERRGVFYTIQTIIEAIIDMVAMIIKDLGFEVKDDASNIDQFAQVRNIPKKLCDRLKQANSLRYILVHRYNGADEKKILDSIGELTEILTQWLQIIERCIDELSTPRNN